MKRNCTITLFCVFTLLIFLKLHFQSFPAFARRKSIIFSGLKFPSGTTTASSSTDFSSLAQDVETAPQEEYPDPARANPDDIEQQPTEYHITETPVGAERPPSPPSCSKCSRLSKTNRRLQKENAYLQ